MSQRTIAENNFAYLLGGLLLFFLLVPTMRLLLGTSLDADLVTEYLPLGFSVFILICVWGLQGNRRMFYIGLILALSQVVLALVEQRMHTPVIKVSSALTHL